MALLNGKMLNISSIVTGPGFMSVRMPVVLVSEKSVWTVRHLTGRFVHWKQP